MSKHNSLKSSATVGGKRSVLKRFERVKLLKERGEWKDGKRNGDGNSINPQGAQYVGEFKDDKPNGQGTYTFANGSKYVGEWKDDKYDGQGTLTFAGGGTETGTWRAGKFVSITELATSNSTSPSTSQTSSSPIFRTVDELIRDESVNTTQKKQKIALRYTDGSQYFGETNKDHKRHGFGEMTYADENIKYGQWIDDRFVDSKDTKITLYKNFLKNERFRPIEIVIPSEIDCEDIKRSTLKKLIFDQLANDGESIESLCALDNKINRRCLNEDKKIYTEKWREFTSKSKISMSESFTRSVNKNIEICEVDVNITLPRGDELKASQLIFSIDKKTSKKTMLSLDAVRWIELTTQSTDILRSTIDEFRRILLLSGEFDARKSSFKFDPMTKKVYLYDILRLEDFYEEHDAANPYFIFNKKLELYYK